MTTARSLILFGVVGLQDHSRGLWRRANSEMSCAAYMPGRHSGRECARTIGAFGVVPVQTEPMCACMTRFAGWPIMWVRGSMPAPDRQRAPALQLFAGVLLPHRVDIDACAHRGIAVVIATAKHVLIATTRRTPYSSTDRANSTSAPPAPCSEIIGAPLV